VEAELPAGRVVVHVARGTAGLELEGQEVLTALGLVDVLQLGPLGHEGRRWVTRGAGVRGPRTSPYGMSTTRDAGNRSTLKRLKAGSRSISIAW
jgi:hypothetical protein